SISFDFTAVTPSSSDHTIAQMGLQVPPQNERRCAATWSLLIISLAAADVAESGASIEPSCRQVILVDFQKHPAHADTGKATQMQTEQAMRKSSSSARRCDRNR